MDIIVLIGLSQANNKEFLTLMISIFDRFTYLYYALKYFFNHIYRSGRILQGYFKFKEWAFDDSARCVAQAVKYEKTWGGVFMCR